MQSKDDKRAYNRIRYWKNRKAMRKQQKKYWKTYYPKVKAKKSKYQHRRLKMTYEKRRGYALKAKYGLSCVEYLKMLKAQDDRCAICYGINPHNYALAVDHNHKTGNIRALLCNSCNAIIGHAKDSVKRLDACIQYLELKEKTDGTRI